MEYVIGAVNEIAGLEDESGQYRSPWTAKDMGEILKKIADRYNSLCIKRREKKKCEEIREFLALLKEDFSTTVGTLVKESCLEKKAKELWTTIHGRCKVVDKIFKQPKISVLSKPEGRVFV